MEIQELIAESINVKKSLLEKDSLFKIQKIADILIEALRKDKIIFMAGNGGSAADAQHFAAELAGKFELKRPGLKALALTTNTSNITAIANDFDYDEIFSRQLEAMAGKNDVFVGISTSGSSRNIIKAMEMAKIKGALTVGLLGQEGGELKKYCDEYIIVKSFSTARIQESHILIIHILSKLIDEVFKKTSNEKYIFLDRDGVIVRDKDHTYKISDLEFMPLAIEGLKALQEKGYKFIVITNQSGIARKMFTENDMELFHQKMIGHLKKNGIHILKIYHCPHHPEFTGQCICRKPKTGLVEKAVQDYGMDPSACLFVGDKDSDTLVGKHFGAKTFLINNNQYKTTIEPNYSVKNLMQILEIM